LIWNLEIRGEKLVPPEGGVIVAANHLSFFDPPLLWMHLPRRAHFLAKVELFKNRLFAALITAFNAISVDRERYDRRAIRRCLEVLSSGGCLVIFPEGSRGPEGMIRGGYLGVGFLAQKAKVPIVPVYLENTKTYVKSIITRRQMQVRFGEPIDSGWLSEVSGNKEGYRKIAGETMNRIRMLSETVSAASR
jgi:1-acyl-sn-glycerol-3-phosphate acyltransferase